MRWVADRSPAASTIISRDKHDVEEEWWYRSRRRVRQRVSQDGYAGELVDVVSELSG
jgi:hypothetical protein